MFDILYLPNVATQQIQKRAGSIGGRAIVSRIANVLGRVFNIGLLESNCLWFYNKSLPNYLLLYTGKTQKKIIKNIDGTIDAQIL